MLIYQRVICLKPDFGHFFLDNPPQSRASPMVRSWLASASGMWWRNVGLGEDHLQKWWFNVIDMNNVCPFGKNRGAGWVYHLSSFTSCWRGFFNPLFFHQPTNGNLGHLWIWIWVTSWNVLHGRIGTDRSSAKSHVRFSAHCENRPALGGAFVAPQAIRRLNLFWEKLLSRLNPLRTWLIC